MNVLIESMNVFIECDALMVILGSQRIIVDPSFTWIGTNSISTDSRRAKVSVQVARTGGKLSGRASAVVVSFDFSAVSYDEVGIHEVPKN